MWCGNMYLRQWKQARRRVRVGISDVCLNGTDKGITNQVA